MRPMEEMSTKIISNLQGELLNKDHDPQQRVDVQRQWLPQTDAAIKTIQTPKYRRYSQVNYFDNANSLALGEGQQLAFMRPSANKSSFPRRGSDVTRVPNQIITRK